jgi:MFS family permease
MRRFWRAESALPATIVLAAAVLAVSEFMTAFQFSPPGGDPLSEQVASDRHGYAMLILAVFAVASMLLAIATGQRMAALATAGFGVAALVIFLVIDLPDVNKLGDIEDPAFGLATAKAVPQAGFWLEAVAAVALGMASVAYATLTPEQLQSPRRRWQSRRQPGDDGTPKPETKRRTGKPIDSGT